MSLEDSEARALANLKRKRGVIKGSLTRVRTFIEKFDPRSDALTLLQFRQEELPHINRKFDDIQCQIELIDLDNSAEAETERENFEKEYYSIRSNIQEIINLEKAQDLSIHNVSSSVQGPRALLAPISLPQFNGNILEWESFYDCFKVLVHNEEMYSAAQKFSYLRSTLTGQALDVVKGIPMTEANYNVAIKKLLDRYDNRSLVIQSHIRSILDLPCVKPDSPKDLQELHSLLSTHVTALEALGQPVAYWDAWLITIILRKLDQSTIHAWQMRQTDTELPTYNQLDKFLAGRCVAFESTQSWSSITNDDSLRTSLRTSSFKKPNVTNNIRKSLLVTKDSPEDKCACCSDNHRLFLCPRFKEMQVSRRITLAREARLCFNCLSSFHMADKCRSKYSCMKCKKRHNTLLHYETQSNIAEGKEINDFNHGSASEQVASGSNAALVAHHSNGHVFLPTVIALVSDNHGVERKCRTILDSGSQINFVSKRLANMLQLPRIKVDLPVIGIGQNQVRSVSSISLKVRSRVRHFEVELICHVLPIIIEHTPSCSMSGLNIPQELIPQLADPSFSTAGNIDLLIGGGIFFDLLESGKVQLQSGNACLQDTKFGWVMTGEIGPTCLLAANTIGEELEENFRATIRSEDIFSRSSKANQKCLEEKAALAHFEKTSSRNTDGRFVLRLPLRPEVASLGDTLKMATSRFLNIERRLQTDATLKESYIKFMEEYERAGHMQEVTDMTKPAGKVFYLPHHPVLKASSLTTKLRVVFDGSAKSSTGASLNDVLMCGPTVQEELFSILVRFRIHQYVITADVEKMFRQVAIAIEDQDLQRIVWRYKPSDKLRSYRLTTVTYGTTSASFMATQCLRSIAETEKKRYPKASVAIRRDFYMDDLITGAETIEECISLQAQISTILNSAKLPLRKWCSNSSKILESVNEVENDHLFIIQAKDGEIIKSLGLCWKPSSDELGFHVVPAPNRTRVTKRILLSDLNRIFDPLGLLTPVLIRGKIFVQQLWQMKMDWDKPLPEDIAERWQRFYQQLEELGSLSIPRKCKPFTSEDVELHGFCDASEEAYGACIYVRCKFQNDQWVSRLLCSRSRVAPLKGATIPRLELGGALILAQLASKVAAAWDLEVRNFHLWTDSMVVLGWIYSENIRFKTYVANRVEQILELTNSMQWKHVKTAENPADILSRGITPQELKLSELWWNGPQWLLDDKHMWNQPEVTLLEREILPEQKTVKLVLAGIHQERDLVTSYSSWQRLVRATAWILKFIEYRRSLNSGVSCSKFLSVAELRKAENGLIRQAQLEEFGEDFRALIRGKEVPHRSKLRSLCPFINENNLIAVGGRLQNSDVTRQRKHPIVLPSNHKVTRLIFENYHKNLLHGGPQLLLAELRLRFWPLRARILARSVLAKCIQCIRAKPKFVQPLMAPLPKDRVQPCRPFGITGVDFAGPLIIRSEIRRVTGKKAWIAVFVCFTTRAIHLEAVEDLTSGSFIASLRRFMSRRGKCARIYSDNGTNFVGAQRELAICMKKIDEHMAHEGIEWIFNPPSAPHFGGLWESAVKTTKFHLTRMMKDTSLTLGELTTLLCQIEACVNSRPMTPLSSEPSEMEALTPAHFLIGGAMFLPPEVDLTSESVKGLRRWKYVQYLLQHFWKRWEREYLPQCQIRNKWIAKIRPLVVNDVVIIRGESTHPTKWKLGKVIELHPGKDGIVRVVTLKTANGTQLRRPTVKLCRLPVQEEESIVENHDFQRGGEC